MPKLVMSNDVTVAILAGGQSSRMGQDKSFVPFEGQPMIERVLARVNGLGQETILITNTPDDYAYLQLPLFGDVYPNHGSLGGIFTAVTYAAHPYTLVVACDMPWLNPDLLQHMISLRGTADVIVPRWQKFPEPLHAIYHKDCLSPMEANIKEKRLKITNFFGQVQVRFIDQAEIRQFDRNGRSFANINTPDDLVLKAR